MLSNESPTKAAAISPLVHGNYSPRAYTLTEKINSYKNCTLNSDYLFGWCYIYSSGLTRAKHAFFDEFNVLETYQPRARTMGHLFTPEPPTPVPDSQRQQQNPEKEADRTAFLEMRNAHYENEYTYLEKVNRELKGEGNLAKQARNVEYDGKPGIPKIEGPILIEFHADSEKDDDDYSL
uniref:Uncharacterized protein n=1 Tax=Setaria digitata TaxID=48799 RepID=A0A915PPF2_9BILA